MCICVCVCIYGIGKMGVIAMTIADRLSHMRRTAKYLSQTRSDRLTQYLDTLTYLPRYECVCVYVYFGVILASITVYVHAYVYVYLYVHVCGMC